MGTVVPFRKKSQKLRPARYLRELNGERPVNHPKVSFGPRGKVLLAERQVWITLHNQELWVIRRLHLEPSGRYRVYLSRYGSRVISWTLSEISFRANLQIWDKTVEELKALVEKVRQSIEDGEGEYFGITTENCSQVMKNFFGLDPITGERDPTK